MKIQSHKIYRRSGEKPRLPRKRKKYAKKLILIYKSHQLLFEYFKLQKSGIIIEDPHVVKKSYPNFWDDMRQVGFVVEEVRIIDWDLLLKNGRLEMKEYKSEKNRT
jgi:hypothetical protein